MSNPMLSEEMTESLLMSSQDTTLLLYPVISSHRDLVPAAFRHIHIIF